MKLYILRHGDAETSDPEKQPDDALRPLVKRGEKKSANIAGYLKKHKTKIDLILTSPAMRSLDAAKIIRKGLKLKKEQLVKLDALLPEGDNAALVAEIKEKYPVDRVLIVGHNPNMAALISQLVTGTPNLPIRLRKGGLCKLSIDELEYGKCAILEWLVDASR